MDGYFMGSVDGKIVFLPAMAALIGILVFYDEFPATGTAFFW